MDNLRHRTFRARYRAGAIEPLEPLDLPEGAELLVTATRLPTAVDPTLATAGAWKDLLDCEQFERDIYRSRLPRP